MSNQAEELVSFGLQATASGDYFGAEGAFRAALRDDPRNPALMCELGHVLRLAGKTDEAVRVLRRGLRLAPAFAQLHATLAGALIQQGKMLEALAEAKRAVQLNPALAVSQNNLGQAQLLLGGLDEAMESFRRAIAADPQCVPAQYNLGLALLMHGEFAGGWAGHQWRPGAVRPPSSRDALRGRDVVLVGEQGLGDQLFYLRFAPALKKLGAAGLIARVEPRLVAMLARTGIFRTVAELTAGVPAGALQLSVGDLPLVVGMASAAEAPAPLPLKPDPAILKEMGETLARLGPPPYIGVTWRGGFLRAEGAYVRETPAEDLGKALRPSTGTVVTLQRMPGAEERAAFVKALGRAAHDLDAESESPERSLALMCLLDDYIGVSNTNMHLRAGAGRGARVLVPVPPQWRWMAEGDSSPWFPGFRVYRQMKGDSWADALARLARDLGG